MHQGFAAPTARSDQPGYSSGCCAALPFRALDRPSAVCRCPAWATHSVTSTWGWPMRATTPIRRDNGWHAGACAMPGVASQCTCNPKAGPARGTTTHERVRAGGRRRHAQRAKTSTTDTVAAAAAAAKGCAAGRPRGVRPRGGRAAGDSYHRRASCLILGTIPIQICQTKNWISGHRAYEPF